MITNNGVLITTYLRFNRFTCLAHCDENNHRNDFKGIDSVCNFEAWCIDISAIWGFMANEETGDIIATYRNKIGLTTLNAPLTLS